MVRKEALTLLRPVCEALVLDTYATWRMRCAGVETARRDGHAVRNPDSPHLTVAWIRRYLMQAGSVVGVQVPTDFQYASRYEQSSWIQGALESLVKAGKLERYIGCGERLGTEARGYAPVST